MQPDAVPKTILDRAQEILVPFDTELGMEAALHEDAGTAQLDGLPDFVEDHFLRMHVALGVAHGTVKGAETAVLGAEIGVVDIAVDDVADNAVRVQPPAHGVRGHSDADKVITVEKIDGFLA